MELLTGQIYGCLGNGTVQYLEPHFNRVWCNKSFESGIDESRLGGCRAFNGFEWYQLRTCACDLPALRQDKFMLGMRELLSV